MSRNSDYDDNDAFSDSDESVSSIDLKVKEYTLDDYLNFKSTREVLQNYHYQTFLNNAAPQLQNLLDEIYDYCKKQISSCLILDPAERQKGTIIGMIYNHIDIEYDIKIFEEYPHLIKPLITAEKEKNNNNNKI